MEKKTYNDEYKYKFKINKMAMENTCTNSAIYKQKNILYYICDPLLTSDCNIIYWRFPYQRPQYYSVEKIK